MTRLVLIGLFVTTILATASIVYYFRIRNYRLSIRSMEIHNVDLSTIPDGVYTGAAELQYVAAKVKVEVENHRITSIQLTEHKQERGEPAEILIGRVVETQSLELDTVSGATASSKVILKAIENALTTR